MDQNQPKSIDEISDKEIETYIHLSEFSVGKAFFTILIIASAVGFLLQGLAGIAFAVVTVSIFKFVLMPIIMRMIEPLARKHDPKGYKNYLDWQKRKYHKEYYEGSGANKSSGKDEK
jgi:uncharacterized membrane protein